MRDLLTDKVSLIRKNGDIVDNIFASVQGRKVFMDDMNLKMEDGDKLIRILPNGKEETYLILNLKYLLFGDLSHIEIDVKKDTQIDPLKPQELHIHSSNSQMIINSPNSKLNAFNIVQGDLFERLRQAVDTNITDNNIKMELLSQLEELEKAQGDESFSERYNRFIASAANHATLWSALSPFISPLLEIMH